MHRDHMEQILRILSSSGLILYPTDTVWGIGCDATDEAAVRKVYRIKKRDRSKSLLVLFSGMEMLKAYLGELSPDAEKYLTDDRRPTSVVFYGVKGLAPDVYAADGSVAVRLAYRNPHTAALIDAYGKPLVSTSANISGEPAALQLEEINDVIKNRIDVIYHVNDYMATNKPSRILRQNRNGEWEVLRE